MLSLLRSLANLKREQSSVLKALSKKELRRNIKLRLSDYWKIADLPHELVASILNLLWENRGDEDCAIKEVRKKFPEMADMNSPYFKKLEEFRETKVKNLARRLSPHIVGEDMADVGGRADDLVSEILKLKPTIKKAYVTDIGSFSQRSQNEKITFLVQPSLARTPFPLNSMDCIILSMVLHHIEIAEQVLIISHLNRVLRKGGRIILIEDTYPNKLLQKNLFDEDIIEYLNFTREEKMSILSFYDWFGNRLMRKRDNIALTYNYRSMEEWKTLFEKEGFKEIYSEFIKANKFKPDLFPPKGLMVYEKK